HRDAAVRRLRESDAVGLLTEEPQPLPVAFLQHPSRDIRLELLPRERPKYRRHGRRVARTWAPERSLPGEHRTTTELPRGVAVRRITEEPHGTIAEDESGRAREDGLDHLCAPFGAGRLVFPLVVCLDQER